MKILILCLVSAVLTDQPATDGLIQLPPTPTDHCLPASVASCNHLCFNERNGKCGRCSNQTWPTDMTCTVTENGDYDCKAIGAMTNNGTDRGQFDCECYDYIENLKEVGL